MRRGLTPDLAVVLDREVAPLQPSLLYGPVIEVNFPAAATARDVRHRMGTIPTGVVVLAAEGGNVQVSALSSWDETVAYLVADANYTRARVVFVRTVSEVIDDAT